MINIILCGGCGTRLWPLSRTLMPKQFVTFFHDKSLFQLTVLSKLHALGWKHKVELDEDIRSVYSWFIK